MKIELRKITLNDNDTELAVRLVNKNMPFLYNDKPVTKEGHQKFVTNLLTKDDEIMWVINCDGVDVGLVALVHINNKYKKTEFGRFMVEENYPGVGSIAEYMVIKYTFDTLGLNKIYCEVLKDNSRAINLHKKFGFEQEGDFKDWILKNNEFKDVVMLSLSSKDWNDKYKEKIASMFKRHEIIIKE